MLSSTDRPTLVLVGHGMVGQRLLEELAARDALAGPDGTDGPGTADGVPEGWRWCVVVLAEEERRAYDRVHLSSLFTGTTPEELSLAAPDFLERHDITLRLGDPVTALDTTARTVTTRTGATWHYDALVLATGSYAFVPPVPGRDAPGCFVYRTVEDVRAIQEAARGARTAAVIGGGLLGLEAVGALRSLGLDTGVVEAAPRLMPAQVDAGGADALAHTIEAMGVRVYTDTVVTEVRTGTDGQVRGLSLSDGRSVPADVVVFSVGVRPRDELARTAGLDVADRGGIVIDAGCRTSVPGIYALGECARAADGEVYGLVAPGYRMAEALADTLTGGDGSFTGADTSTKLKLLGADVASFGDPFAPDARDSVIWADSGSGVYKKLVLGPDGRLVGGILVGDADVYGTLRPLVGTPLPGPAASFLLPGEGTGPADTTAVLPDDAVICSCNGVTKGALRDAVRSGAHDLAAVKKCTGAATRCGGCLGAVTSVVEAQLAADGIETGTGGLCPDFTQTRRELYEIVRVTGISSFTRLAREYGVPGPDGTPPHGCAVCRPTVASLLATLGPELGLHHILDGEQAALQDTNDLFLANLQKDGTYSVVPRLPAGEISPEHLVLLGEIARDFGLYAKLTGGQRIDLFGATVDQLPVIWRRLADAGLESGHAYGKSLRTAKSCAGSRWCRFGQRDSIGMAVELELRYRGLRSPHKLKLAASGCVRECAEARSKDVGVIATAKGWNLYVGGNGGSKPRHADLLAQDLDDRELIRVVDRFLMFYIRTADRLERTAAWLERIDGGIGHVRDVVLHDCLGLSDELESQMQRHVDAYRDEWRAVLEDPAKLRRFTSSLPAPEGPAAPGHVQVRTRAGEWTSVCLLEDLEPGRGVPVRVGEEKEAVALFRSPDGEIFAVCDTDPASHADVISRGIYGAVDGIPVVTSPMYKQRFDLRTGACLDDESRHLTVHAVRLL
ncbi:nitrite reductase large subunit NirB [Streptomyces sp. NPDC017056]|uniref:nitrite reductase large subunit NirB n=1 Tax=Streptomyces sp. NPDC017056 TaxID=3364973 RepID=UPI00379F5150